MVLQKLGCWYRYRYLQNSPSSSTIANLIQGFVAAGRLHPPKKRKLQNAYYAIEWETKLKPAFDAWWATYQLKFGNDAGCHILKERNQFVERALKAESKDYQDNLHAQIESEHKVALSKWKDMTGSAKTVNNFGGEE